MPARVLGRGSLGSVIAALRARAGQLIARFRRPRLHRVAVPTVLQMEAIECGAACLAMVLAHFGRWVPLDDLRVAAGVSRDGSNASNLLRAARQYGLTARGLRLEPGELPAHGLPMIVFWAFNHFVVVEGVTPSHAYINDPASGPRRIDRAQFDANFTGVALALAPGLGFRRAGQPPCTIRALLARLAGMEWAAAFVLIASLCLVVPGLILPNIVRIFIDNVLIQGNIEWVEGLLVALGLGFVVVGLFTWLQQAYLMRLETKLMVTTSGRMVWQLLRLPISFFVQRFAGDIAARLRAGDRLAQLLSGQLATNAVNLVTVLFFVELMALYDLVLTFLAVALTLTNVAVLRLGAERRANLNRNALQDEGKLMATGISGIAMIETLKATSGENDFFARWAGYQAKVLTARHRLQLWSADVTVWSAMISALTTATVLGIGGLRVIDGHLSVGELVAFQLLLAGFAQPFQSLVAFGGQLQEIGGQLARIDDIMSHPPAFADEETGKRRGVRDKLTGKVTFDDVTFGYAPLDPPLIEGLSFEIAPGGRLALVGRSGSGKSTVAKLLAGTYRPWSGRILIDDLPIDEIPRCAIISSLSVVDQDIVLFDGTIRENLSLWDPSVPESDLVAAARDAAIHDEIAARPGAYESRIDHGGANFSGGQAQRLEIARALVTNPSVVILDEATSALDPLTELAIDRNLRRRGVTSLIVAHRLSTIRDCDEIIVLDRGRAVERGSHEALLDRDQAYAALVKAA